VTLGAHTRTQVDLRRLGGDALAEEIVGAFEDIARETEQRPDG
jgi:hypothetical protein